MPDADHLFDWAVGVILAGMSWFLKLLHGGLETTKDALHRHEVHVAQTYVRHEDMTWVKETLTRIEDKLDRKVDK